MWNCHACGESNPVEVTKCGICARDKLPSGDQPTIADLLNLQLESFRTGEQIQLKLRWLVLLVLVLLLLVAIQLVIAFAR